MLLSYSSNIIHSLLFYTLIIYSFYTHITHTLNCINSCGTGCTTNSGYCHCGLNSAADIWLALSIHGDITAANFQKELTAMNEVIRRGYQNGRSLGVLAYADTDHNGGNPYILRAYGTVTNIGIPNWTFNAATVTQYYSNPQPVYGATVSSAIDYITTNTWDTIQESTQRLVVIVINTDPYTEDSTPGGIPSLAFVDTQLCIKAQAAKRDKNIRFAIVAVGNDGVDYHSSAFECVVNNPSTDIIKVPDYDSFATKYDDILNFLCADQYKFRITEVQPVGSTAFIEMYNYGRTIPNGVDIELSGSATASVANNANILTGTYFTLFNTAAPCTGRCFPTNTAITAASKSSFSFTVTIGGAGSDTVTWSSNRMIVEDGYSYQLYSRGFGSNRAFNWRQSCTAPSGNINADTSADVCTYAGCSQARCQISGASGTSCPTDSLCQCASCPSSPCANVGFFPYGTNCEPIGETATCTARQRSDPGSNNLDVIQFFFQPVDTELSDIIKYQVQYTASGGQIVTTSCGDLSLPYCMVQLSNFQQPISAKSQAVTGGVPSSALQYITSGVSCARVTESPTVKPTTNPVLVPTNVPTKPPTPFPTFGEPSIGITNTGDFGLREIGVDGTCKSRCSCNGNFPECVGNRTYIPNIQSSVNGNPNIIPIKFEDVAAGSFNNRVCYVINEAGLVNKSCITDGTSCGSATTRRRRLMEMLYGNRRRLATGNNITDAASLRIQLEPLGGCFWMNETVKFVELMASEIRLSCESGSNSCFDDCSNLRIWYQFNITNCTSDYGQCRLAYPYSFDMYVGRGDCNLYYKGGGDDEGIPDWVWWVIIAVIIFLIILACLVYRFWWRGKKQNAELADAEDELQQQTRDNDDGIGADLDTGDVVFNPMATGVPGMNRPVDAFGNEIQQRQLDAQNEVADVQVNPFKEREAYGQVQQQSGHQRNMYGGQ